MLSRPNAAEERRDTMDFEEVPVGFGMALAQNEEAMNTFAMMTGEEKQAVWSRARGARTKAEMQRIVSDIITKS